MEKLARIGITLPVKLLNRFDEEIPAYANRSDAIRHLMRDYMVERQWEGDETVVGTITLVYNHHQTELHGSLTEFQHKAGEMIISTLHIHLSCELCLETIVVRGKASKVLQLSEQLIASRGVVHGRLSATTLGDWAA